jgi:hypothetical protein
MATTRRERVREVLRSREPLDAKTVIALAGDPMLWTTDRNRVLLEYFLPWSDYFDVTSPRVLALRVVDERAAPSPSQPSDMGWARGPTRGLLGRTSSPRPAATSSSASATAERHP